MILLGTARDGTWGLDSTSEEEASLSRSEVNVFKFDSDSEQESCERKPQKKKRKGKTKHKGTLIVYYNCHYKLSFTLIKSHRDIYTTIYQHIFQKIMMRNQKVQKLMFD